MTNEQELDESDNADAIAFEKAWANWSLKSEIADHIITEEHLRSICVLWFGKGNARGCAWGAEMAARMVAKL